MSTRTIAKKLIRYCRELRHREAVKELYADRCTSREMPGVPDEFVVGKQAIVDKNDRWFASLEEFHRSDISDPVVAGNFFSCQMTLDVTFRGRERMRLQEICVYEVCDGLIVSEQFFYSDPNST